MAGEIKAVLDHMEHFVPYTFEGLGVSLVPANVTDEQPSYPYISYTLSSIQENAGSWGEYADGERRKPCSFVVSFTVQSDDMDEVLTIAEGLHDFLDSKNTLLDENNIVVTRCQSITNRDTLLTYEYEYRQGFDVIFSVMRSLDSSISPKPEEVDVEFNQEVLSNGSV